MQNRRNFLKNSLFAITGAGLAGRSHPGTERHNLPRGENRTHIYRTLGKTGIEIPVISMGTGNCDNPNLVREALDQGVKLLATSEYYQNGNNEKMLGEVLKDRARDSFMIQTGTNEGIEVDYRNGLFKSIDPEVFLEHVDGCLKRLQLDYVDVFYIGSAARRESILYEPILKTMESLKTQGKARFIGIGTHSFEPEAIRAAADSGVYDLVTVAYNFRKENREETGQALQYAADAGLGIIGMKTMAGVYWDRGKTRPINTRASLKWVLQNENVHTTIPDCTTFDELYQDLDLMGDLELTPDELKDLNPPSDGTLSDLFCQQCLKCVSQCPYRLNIPTAMRSYMYAYGYGNLEQARSTLDLSGIPDRPCEGCSVCPVKCPIEFDIKRKITDIARLRQVPQDLIRATVRTS
jgi:predicted aldo/keto reductase-like oxidoreductase